MTKDQFIYALTACGCLLKDGKTWYEHNELIKCFEDLGLFEQEPRKGHWIGIDEEPHEDYECDKCGYTISTYTANIKPHTEYMYCPNCGAKMESEE